MFLKNIFSVIFCVLQALLLVLTFIGTFMTLTDLMIFKISSCWNYIENVITPTAALFSSVQAYTVINVTRK